MNSISPTSRTLARRLLAFEADGKKTASGAAGPDDAVGDAVHVCEKLGAALTPFTGSVGVRSLLTRALTLAKAREPALASVRIRDDGSFAWNEPAGERTKKGDVDAGAHALVANLLELLVVFVGEALTLRLVRGAWPDEAASVFRSTTEETA